MTPVRHKLNPQISLVLDLLREMSFSMSSDPSDINQQEIFSKPDRVGNIILWSVAD
jgi:hypothetical protein